MHDLLLVLAVLAGEPAAADAYLEPTRIVEAVRKAEGDDRAAVVAAALERTTCKGCTVAAGDAGIVLAAQLQSALGHADCKLVMNADAPGAYLDAVKRGDDVLARPENVERMRDALRRVRAIPGVPSPPAADGAPPLGAKELRYQLVTEASQVCWAVEPEPREGWGLEQALLKFNRRCVTERGRLLQGYAQTVAAIAIAPAFGPACTFPASVDALLVKVEHDHLEPTPPSPPTTTP
jgi:hypothetical protein